MREDPPQLARRLLGLIPQPDREFVEGDLEEEYALQLSLLGRRGASAWYWRQVLASLPWFGVHGAIERLGRPITTQDLQRRIMAMAALLGGAPTPRTPAFGNRLLASKPIRAEGTFATSLMSLTFHLAMLGGLVISTIGNHVDSGEDAVSVIEVVSPMEEEAAPPPPPPQTDDAPIETDPTVFAAPAEIPIDIPPPGVTAISAEDLYKEMLEASRDTTDETSAGVLDIGATPTFTPFEVAPEMLNRDEIGRALGREYPPLLRDAGVGGSVEVWIYLDEAGAVQNAQVNASSGQPTLDEAALRVARIMEFSPAMNRDKTVPVWVKVPITFQVR